MSKIRKASLAAAPDPRGRSDQPEDEDLWTPDDAITPPENFDGLAKLTQVSRTRRSCLAATVLNTVGRGFDVVPLEGMEQEADEKELIEIRQQLDALAARDKRLGRPTFTRLLSAVKWDEQEVGNGYLEVSRNRVTGEIDGLFHAVGKRVRRRRDRTGWLIGSRRRSSVNDRISFYDFGEKVNYSDDGKPAGGTLRARSMRHSHNEILPLQLYTSESRDYGLPPDAQLALDYAGDKLAAETNVGFFGSSGVPPTVIFVSAPESKNPGEEIKMEVDPSLIAAVGDALRSGGDRRRRVAVVPVPAGTNIDKQDLAVLSDRDMGFVDYRRDNRRACLSAFRLAPIFVADIEDTNYSTAEVEVRSTKDQVFDPEQRRWEEMINATLMAEIRPGFGIRFHEMPVEIASSRIEQANAAADRGVITNGEYRSALNLGPLPEGTPEQVAAGEAVVPTGWSRELVKARAIAAPELAPPRPEREEVLKGREADLALELGAEFEATVDDAIRTVAGQLADPSRLEAVVVEKDGDAITISPRRLT